MEKRGEFVRGEKENNTEVQVDREIPRVRMLIDIVSQFIHLHEELPRETKLRMTTLARREGVAEDVQKFVRSMIIRGVPPYIHEGERTKEEMIPEINAFLLALAKELPAKSERGDGDPSPAKQYFQNLRGRRVPAAPGADFINPNSGRDTYRFGVWDNDSDWED